MNWGAVGRQLANPSGTGGRLVGAIMRVANRAPTHSLVEALDIQAGHHVLDVGCGDGSALASLPRGTRLYGLDHSETMLSLARKRLRDRARTGSIMLRQGDMLELPFSDGSFDRILASNVLYFCADVPAFLEECRRVARPNAVLGIYLTCARSMSKWPFAGPETHRQFSPEQLESELRAAAVGSGDFEIRRIAFPAGIDGLIALVRLKR